MKKPIFKFFEEQYFIARCGTDLEFIAQWFWAVREPIYDFWGTILIVSGPVTESNAIIVYHWVLSVLLTIFECNKYLIV